MDTKYEHIKFIIERFDHYYDTVNNKGSFYIGLNTFIFGGLCVGYSSLYKSIHADIWTWILLAVLVMSCLSSTLFTISAIKPYSKDNHSNDDNPSLMYFGGIVRYELNHLKEKFNEQTPEQMNNDALQQMHSLAKGLNGKFKKLRIASVFLQIQFCALIPLFIIIIKNLK